MNTFDISDINFSFQWVGISRNRSCEASISRDPHFKRRHGTHYSDQIFTSFAFPIEVIANILSQTRHHYFCPHAPNLLFTIMSSEILARQLDEPHGVNKTGYLLPFGMDL
jgi:hypothetical protein